MKLAKIRILPLPFLCLSHRKSSSSDSIEILTKHRTSKMMVPKSEKNFERSTPQVASPKIDFEEVLIVKRIKVGKSRSTDLKRSGVMNTLNRSIPSLNKRDFTYF